MQTQQLDEPIPPLEQPGVAPLWRLIGIFGLIAVAVLISMVVVLFVALGQQFGANPGNNWGFVPPAMQAAGGAAAGPDVLDPGNPCYPVKQDLRPAGTFPLPGDPEPAADEVSPRGLFLTAAGREVWTSQDAEPPDRVLVSPNGDNMAYAAGDVLMAGPFGGPVAVELNTGNAPGDGMAGGRRMARRWAAPPAAPKPSANGSRATVCGWHDQIVVWVSAAGVARQYDVPQDIEGATAYDAPPHVEEALLLPEANRLLGVARQSRAKIDGGGAALHDHTTVATWAPRGAGQLPATLCPAGPGRWRWPAVSPDRTRIAIISDHDQKPGDWCVFLVPLKGNNPVPEPVSPPAAQLEGVCWTFDGKGLVYARSQGSLPPDHAPGMPKDACDLFLLDLDTKKETRLSRGGGFASPSMAKDDTLFFLARTPSRQPGTPPLVTLHKIALKDARDFASQQENAERDRATKWDELAREVRKESGDVPGAEWLKKAGDAYAKGYQARFKHDPPTTLAGLERQRREVAALGPPDASRLLMLGAVEGEYLRRQHKDSVWHLGLVAAASENAARGENPFGFAYNPFRPPPKEKADKDDAPQSLAEVLYRAAGRPIVLSNDARLAKEALDKLVDPDLARGADLLKQDRGDEADGVLLNMVKRHPDNHHLAGHVGSLFQQHGRSVALAALCRPWIKKLDEQGTPALPKDARLLNLLGLVMLAQDAGPPNAGANRAVTTFQDALRCDLDYQPAYLNLAAAYLKLQRKADARLCLQRYLKLFPEGEWADDARGRLAVAGDD
jgi:hypothetical protein